MTKPKCAPQFSFPPPPPPPPLRSRIPTLLGLRISPPPPHTPTTEVEAAVLVETLLSQWASGDSKKVELLKYIIGASITDKAWAFKQPDGTYSNAIVVVYGSGDNGKSAYIKLLEKAVIAAGAKDKFYHLYASFLASDRCIIDLAGKTVIASEISYKATIGHWPSTERLLNCCNQRPTAKSGIKLMYVNFNSRFVCDVGQVDVDNYRFLADFNLVSIFNSSHVKDYLRQLAESYAAKFLALEDFGSLF